MVLAAMTTGARRRGALAALGALLLLALALTGHGELALYVAPVLGALALPASGRFVGEERIVRAWRRLRAAVRPRRRASRWQRGHELPLASQLRRSPLGRRGPPRAAAATA
jgi:hypothetical protein